MSLQGTYDPNVFVDGNTATYPSPIGATYEPGQFWEFSVGGTFDGTAVSAGDRAYVSGHARRFGEGDFGDDLFGDPAGSSWPAYSTEWVLWFADQYPWGQEPPLSGGAPFLPGWRIHIEWLEDQRAAVDDGNFSWSEVAQCMEVTITRGGSDGRQELGATELQVIVHDPDGTILPIGRSAKKERRVSGDRIRIGLSDGTQFYPLEVGRVDDITDIHDNPPRVVRIQAYGLTSDLAGVLVGLQRPEETAAARAAALETASGWDWSPWQIPGAPGPTLAADAGPIDTTAKQEGDRTALSSLWSLQSKCDGGITFVEMPYQGEGGTPDILISDMILNAPSTWEGPGSIVGSFAPSPTRQWAHSTTPFAPPWTQGDAWTIDNDGWIRDTPVRHGDILIARGGGELTPERVQWDIYTRTQQGTPNHIFSDRIQFQSNTDEMLNDAVTTTRRPTDGAAALTSQSTGADSQDRFGIRSRGQGFPLTNLACKNQADVDAAASTYRERYEFIGARVEALDFDTSHDTRWLQVVADLEQGQLVEVVRAGLPGDVLSLQAVVCGYRLKFTSRGPDDGRIEGTLFLTGASEVNIYDGGHLQTPAGDNLQTPYAANLMTPEANLWPSHGL